MALRISFHQWLLSLFLALLPRLPLLNPKQFVHLSLHLPKLQYHRQLLEVFVSKVIPNKVLIALPQLVNWTLEYREGVIIFIWHIFLKTCFAEAVKNSTFWNFTSRMSKHFHSFKYRVWRHLFSIVYSIYDRLDYASAVLALQRSNDSLIHRLQAGGCIWGKKV